MELNLERVRRKAHKAVTEDLLDRATVYREGMEPAALEIFEEELRSRGVDEHALAAHRERRKDARLYDDGTPVRCSFCHRPAAHYHWGWHRLWGVLPVFPRRFAYCEMHRPGEKAAT
jgi:hypothetical protein